MFSLGWVVALIGALAGLLGYFLPWYNIVIFTINGWQATFGVNLGFGNMGGGNFLIILVLLAPFGVGFLFYRYFKRGGVLRKVEDVFALGGIGALILVLLLVASSGVGTIGTSLGFGWILCLLGALAWLGGAFLNFQKSQKPM